MTTSRLRTAWATALLLVTVGMVVGITSTPSQAATYRQVARRTVAPGVVFTRLFESRPRNRIFVLTVDLSRPASLDMALAARRVGGFEKTSSMAARHGAVAAVNGDFAMWWGRPAHAFADDGSLKFTSMMQVGAQLAVSRDERNEYLGPAASRIRAHLPGRTTPLTVTRWNAGDPSGGKVAGYSSPGVTTSPDRTCGARLRAAGRLRWTSGKRAVIRTYRVRAVQCGSGLPTARSVVLAAARSTAAARRLKALRPGRTVTLSWTMGWPDVHATIGGVPVLVSGGRSVAPGKCSSYFCDRNPRTGIGFTPDGRVLLVVVDGRQPGWSNGMTLRGFGNLFVSLGADRALNLDGGGSSTMVVDGAVVNRPSDYSGERAVSSSVLVLPGADSNDPAFRSSPGSEPPPVGGGSASAAIRDAGSTGGMIDALERGVFGAAPSLPAGSATALRALRRNA